MSSYHARIYFKTGCGPCMGTGKIIYSISEGPSNDECNFCHGTGVYCKLCKGEGVIIEKKKCKTCGQVRKIENPCPNIKKVKKKGELR